MCFSSSPKVDNSVQKQQQKEAEEARRREEERAARIKAGTKTIDAIFNGGTVDGRTYRGFDDAFFDTRRQSYLDYYMPQLDDQFKAARDELTYALARAGTLNSTLAADKQADLTSQYDNQRASILSQADADVANMKSRINQEKSALVAQLNATGDANRVSNEALARTQQMFNEKPSYNPLGDIFAGVASGIGNYFAARDQNALFNAYFGNGGKDRRSVYTVGA